MDKELLHRLTEKINNGSATDDELQLFNAYMNSLAQTEVDWAAQQPGGSDAVKAQLAAMINSRIKPEPASTPVYSLWRKIAVAASVVLCLSVGGYWMMNRPVDQPDAVVAVEQEIRPGGNKATLTLADGRTIELSSAQSGIVTGEQITYANGAPVEQATTNPGAKRNQLLSLHTPRGGTYTITLPDGTQAWLNAETTISYPERFDDTERVIQLSGEAYFAVKTAFTSTGKKIPFKVVTSQQTVEVLGTQFNMTAYPDQETVKTTLVEGRVAVNTEQSSTLLKPNQQAITHKGITRVKAVDVGNFIAWREGKFSFDGKTLAETLDEIGRWYNLAIAYEDGVPAAELTGDAFRNENIKFVFRVLNVAGVAHKLDINQRKLTILKKK